jgi:hypothetical protein
MRIQAVIGIILTLLGMVGMAYAGVAVFDQSLPQTPMTGIVVVAFLSFYVGTLILRRIIESL